MLIAIIGKGKMGKLLASQAEEKGISVAGLYDITDKEKLLPVKTDVVVDFSHRDNLSWVLDYCKEQKAALVYGTTGLTPEDLDAIHQASETIPVFYSPNYSVGIAVLNKVLAMVTPLLKEDFDMEIVEKHHNQKKDAPSGTALQLLKTMDPDHEFKHVFGREGQVGARTREIGIHALRGGTLAGEHTVYYLGNDEVLEFKHNATSRIIFVNGALKAVEFIENKPAGFYNMDNLMGE